MPVSAPAPRNVLRIRQLNDALRTTLQGGRVLMTQGILSLPVEVQTEVLKAVIKFDDFNPDNDPLGEHDCFITEVWAFGYKPKILVKIDAYDLDQRFASPDPADPLKTCRTMVIMLASEY